MAFNKSQKVKNTREAIMKMFPDRSLISVAHPFAPTMQGDLAILESDGNDLKPCEEYVAGAQNMQNKFFTDTPAKQIWSKTITGATLASLLYEYI